MRRKILTITAGTVLSAMALTACQTTTPTNNATITNSNQAVVVNNNSALVNSNSSTMNSNMMSNSNSRNSNVTREDYDRNRADYEKDRGSSTIGQGVNDSWLWFKTKTALAAVNDLRDSTINVDVVNDVVTLRGTVGTAAQKAQAVATAKGIDGVKSVTDQLKVSANDSMTNQMVNGNTNSRTNSNANR